METTNTEKNEKTHTHNLEKDKEYAPQEVWTLYYIFELVGSD